jgi:iron-sulfur cluster repair protein YtfE (RIC family)
MNDSDNWLLHDHRKYEGILAKCRAAFAGQDWKQTEWWFHELLSLLKGHFLMEEQVLFPAYEGLAAAPPGPTRNLRKDHDEIRALLRQLSVSLDAREPGEFSNSLASLEACMGQHHEKEEELFLPMAGHALLEGRERVVAELKRHDWRYAMRSWDA